MTKIYVFSIMWNEEYILPYFLRHYSTFADKIFIINDHSTDKTVEIALSHPKVEVLDFPHKRGLHNDDFNECFEAFYKKHAQGKADWVMCVDADEFIYHPDIKKYLNEEELKEVNVLEPISYMMVSREIPKTDGQIYDVCKTGERTPKFVKPVVFKPEWGVKFVKGKGRHQVNLPVKKSELLLLHYKYLSRDYLIKKALESYKRRPEMDEKTKKYRLDRALKHYDSIIKAGLKEVI